MTPKGSKGHAQVEAREWLKEMGLEGLAEEFARMIYIKTNLRAEIARPLAADIVLIMKKRLEGRITVGADSVS